MEALKAKIIVEVKELCPSHQKEVEVYFNEVERIYSTPLPKTKFQHFRQDVEAWFSLPIDKIPEPIFNEIFVAESKVLKKYGLLSTELYSTAIYFVDVIIQYLLDIIKF